MTLDSASNNDRMIRVLPEKVPAFAGEASQVRCFNHVLNIVARMIVKQFDVPKHASDAALEAAEIALRELAAGTDIEESMTVDEMSQEGTEDLETDLLDDDDGWIDERDLLTVEELKALNDSVRPVRLILVKVS